MDWLATNVAPAGPVYPADRVKLAEPDADSIDIETMDAHFVPTTLGEAN